MIPTGKAELSSSNVTDTEVLPTCSTTGVVRSSQYQMIALVTQGDTNQASGSAHPSTRSVAAFWEQGYSHSLAVGC